MADLDAVVALDASRAEAAKPDYWRGILAAYGDPTERERRVALLAEDEEGEPVGFLFGEVRAWEFGSEPCGWIFSVAVRPDRERRGLGTRLCEEAVRRFQALGVGVVRTMVRRSDVTLQALFRSMGFFAGPFSELELDLTVPAENGAAPAAHRGGTA
jgi:ribosomal protein S18 acetylase RimI-like enzyme